MVVAHKIALAPNDKQAHLLSKHCGYNRFAHNKMVRWFKNARKRKKRFDYFASAKRFRRLKFTEFRWALSLSQEASESGMRDFQNALNRYFSKKLKAGPPRFISRDRKHSYLAIARRSDGAKCYDSKNRKLKLPKVGEINMRERVRFAGDIVQVTISRRAGRWFASFGIDIGDIDIPTLKGETLGIDMGLKTLAVCSDDREYENPKNLDKYYRKLRKVEKALARSRIIHDKECPKRKHNERCRGKCYARNLLRKQKISAKIQAVRDAIHHNATSALAMTSGIGTIRVETLNVAGMRRNKHLSVAFHRAGISGFLEKLENKTRMAGIAFEKVDRWYPSTKLCSGCGNKKIKMALSERTYRCFSCGLVLDRDLNAARNIANYNEMGDQKPTRGTAPSR